MKNIVLFLLFCSFSVAAQLPAFTVNAVATPQTCQGNGSLMFTVSGTNPAATLEYAIYLLPNTETPVTTVTATMVSNLVAGDYLVVATQSLNGASNTSSASVTIANNATPLVFTSSLTHVNCGNQGAITINVSSGIAVSYEIISGPQTRPLQTSNVFSGLPVGQYQVRVTDSCGDAYVQTVQILQNPVQLWLNNYFFPEPALPACGTITIGQYYGNNYPMMWPVTLTYTIYPPGGGTPITVVHDNITGYNQDQTIVTDIPFYNGQQYTFDVTMTDACGNQVSKLNQPANLALGVQALLESESCGNYFFNIAAINVGLPYTVTFLSAPPGFNPALYNNLHPQSANLVSTYGSDSNPVPTGSYTIQITDACGSTATTQVNVNNQLEPVAYTTVDVFCAGTIEIEIPLGVIASAIVIDAPDAYTGSLPHDVSTFIFNGELMLTNLPVGDYFITVTDVCGFVYEVPVDLSPPPANMTLFTNIAAGCAEGTGSIMLTTSNSFLDSVIITNAPSGFSESLPFDASANITTNGEFVMLSLPAGTYRFETLDKCGNARARQVTIQGFQLQSNNTQVIRNCNSFDIDLKYLSNLNTYDSYWLQKYNENTGTWGHPQNGTPYTGPQNISNSAISLNKNVINYGFTYTGQFRILRVVNYFNINTEYCVSEIYDFVYYYNPAITEAYSFPCSNGLSDVIIEAVGVAPLNYSITTKDGAPFVINNGSSNVFTGLEDAVYNFQVTDGCNNVLNILLNPNDMGILEVERDGFCPGETSTLTVPAYTFLTYQWWKGSDPATILSTTNELVFLDYDPATDDGTYFVRIFSAAPGSCIDVTLEYEVAPNTLPVAGEDASASICITGQLDLNTLLCTPHDEGGIWEDMNATGALTGSIFNPASLQAGVYNFRYKVLACNIPDEAIITVTVLPRPATPDVFVGPACEGNDIQLSVAGIPNATYLWVGPNGFNSTEQNPVLPNASASLNGPYIVRVTVDGCTSLPGIALVFVSPSSVFTLSGNTEICTGQSTELTITPDTPDPQAVYAWYHNNILLQGVVSPSIEVDQPGIYTATVILGNCITEQSITVTENTHPFDVAVASACSEDRYILTITNFQDFEGALFEWTGPNDFSESGYQADITDLPPGTYSAMVVNAEGCTVTESVYVENTSCRTPYGSIPKGISPNNDGDNDTFDLSGLNVKHLMVFNRFGQTVYEKENYRDEWHGQSDRGHLPTGTYYYSLELKDGTAKTGWVYLQR